MEGLNNLLKSFPLTESDIDWNHRIYISVRKLSDYNANFSHKAPSRSSLELFVSQGSLFVDKIYDEFEFWNRILHKWKMSPVKEDVRRGVQSINAFHVFIAKAIKGNELDDKAQTILKCFINQFCQVLENPISKSVDVRIVIRGFGIFTSSCFQYFPESYHKLITLVIQKTELIVLAEDKELRDDLEHFPDYIQALSQIILEGKHELVQILKRSLHNIIVRFFKDFHFLSSWHTPIAVDSMCYGFYNLIIANNCLADDIIEEVSSANIFSIN